MTDCSSWSAPRPRTALGAAQRRPRGLCAEDVFYFNFSCKFGFNSRSWPQVFSWAVPSLADCQKGYQVDGSARSGGGVLPGRKPLVGMVIMAGVSFSTLHPDLRLGLLHSFPALAAFWAWPRDGDYLAAAADGQSPECAHNPPRPGRVGACITPCPPAEVDSTRQTRSLHTGRCYRRGLALRTGCQGLRTNRRPRPRSISRHFRSSSTVMNVTASPERPMRPVRPTRWVNSCSESGRS